MTEWLLNNLYALLPTIETFRPVGYLFIFLFAILESVAFAGFFVPGTIFTIFAGFLVAQGTMSFGWSLLFATVGAFLGDVLGFYLGRHSGGWFKDDSRWLKRSYLDRGQSFFERHGAKSVFLGRFVGPIRPIIPFVAGLSRMKRPTFLFYNALSGFLWALLYLSLGFYLGKISVSLTGDLIKRFELTTLIVALVVAAIFAWWSLRRQPKLASAWSTFLKLFRFRFLATNSRRKLNITTTLLALILFYHLAIGSGLVLSVLTSGSIVSIDNYLLGVFRGWGGEVAEQVFVFITHLGNGWVLLILATLLGLILSRRNLRVALSLFVGLVVTEILVYLGKIFVGRGRPADAIFNEPNFSFPSGHAAGALFFYGFLAFLAWRYLKNPVGRRLVLVILPVMILLIGYSRLYLGVHYPSDIIGGYILGGTILLFALVFSS